ncbi:hypothetical protein QJQ45_025953 [Haematococcus lacustris]|nr:hypothetical protein QJQ45_025953 [Haematococcus lacustris]
MCNITSASFRVPTRWLDGDLMHHPARPLRLDNVAEALKCRGIRNASAPHRVQPVSRKAAKLDEAPLTKRRIAARVLCRPMYAGASGSGQQEVVGERRQVIKAAIRGLVEAALPDLSPAQVDAVVAEVNMRMTMGSKQCCITAVLCLSMLLQSFLGQPTAAVPAAVSFDEVPSGQGGLAPGTSATGVGCDGQLSSQSGSKEQQAPSPPPPLPSPPLSFPMPLLPPPPHLLPSHPPPPPLPHPYPGQEEHGGKDCVTAMLNPLAPPCALVVRPPPPHLLVILTLTLTLGDCHPHPHPHPWWHHLPDPPLPRRCNQEEQPRGAARSGSQEQQLGAAARSGSQEAWARQVVGQGQEAHAPHSQEAQPGGRGSSQQGGSKESAMAHGDNRLQAVAMRDVAGRFANTFGLCIHLCPAPNSATPHPVHSFKGVIPDAACYTSFINPSCAAWQAVEPGGTLGRPYAACADGWCRCLALGDAQLLRRK